MTPSTKCKSAGLSSLAELSELSGQSPQTLNNWFNDKPKLFNVVLLGCAVVKHRDVMQGLLDSASE